MLALIHAYRMEIAESILVNTGCGSKCIILASKNNFRIKQRKKPLEMEVGNVRKALHLIYEYGFGFTVITKSNGISLDSDILRKTNENTKCVVQMTLTIYNEDLCKKLEPNVSTTRERFEVLKKLRGMGIPTVVWLTPILPFINDTEDNIWGILDMCIEAKVYGVICFGMGMTLREGNREYFYEQLDRLFPHLKENIFKLTEIGMRLQVLTIIA